MTPSQALLRLLAARDEHTKAEKHVGWSTNTMRAVGLNLAAACNAYDEAVYAMARRAHLALPATEDLKSPTERHAGN